MDFYFRTRRQITACTAPMFLSRVKNVRYQWSRGCLLKIETSLLLHDLSMIGMDQISRHPNTTDFLWKQADANAKACHPLICNRSHFGSLPLFTINHIWKRIHASISGNRWNVAFACALQAGYAENIGICLEEHTTSCTQAYAEDNEQFVSSNATPKRWDQSVWLNYFEAECYHIIHDLL